ncbi:MAG: Gfo/Idh/MocA family oxidoreductase [Solirubrobacterales bacterium]|nr:Gfo/Idh/MocA family oxidoreductase [Solirubrobacterales bacterium]
MDRALRIGVIGVGLVGSAHIEAIARTGLAEVTAVAASSAESARRAADRYLVPRAEADWRSVVEDDSIDVVHNCTPNHLHDEVGRAALAAGKHLVTEKPLAATVQEGLGLARAAEAASVVSALCHNYRQFAMVVEARELIREGMIGEVHHVHGAYLQGWLAPAGVSNWRLDPEVSGVSTTFADIGTHWCDLAMHLSARRIESVCAALSSRHSRPADDHGGVLLRFDGGVLGTVTASQVSPGAGNSLRIRLDGAYGALYWVLERPEDLWLGRANGPTELRRKSPPELHESARLRAHRPAGEIEGWNTTFVNLFSSVYRRIKGEPLPGDDCVATLSDGLLLMRVVDAVAQSNSERSWLDLPRP